MSGTTEKFGKFSFRKWRLPVKKKLFVPFFGFLNFFKNNANVI